MSDEARLIVAASEKDANLYYACRFLAPDPFIFLKIDGRSLLVLSDLEIDRGRSQARADEILSLTQCVEDSKKRGVAKPTWVDMIDEVLQERSVRRLCVPPDFPIEVADGLRAKGYTLGFKPDPFFEERLIKSEEEIGFIRETMRSTESAIEKAVGVLRASTIGPDTSLLYQGRPLTSEVLKQVINVALMESGCVAEHTIVAGGLQGVDPHHQGTGPLRANQSIVMDVFPRHSQTRYYADITRTFVKGKAAAKLKRMYELVLEGQILGLSMVRDGVRADTIHTAIQALFDKHHFSTGQVDGRMQGFFHGTGHGVGLDIHEPPRISKTQDILKAGQCVTVEPGLYYADAGGVRIEDTVVVRPKGCENLTSFPKFLEIP